MTKNALVCLGLLAGSATGSFLVLSRSSVHAETAAKGDVLDTVERVDVPAGAFLMGSTSGAADEQPIHRVAGPGFAMDRFEVTNGRYQACVEAGGCSADRKSVV